MRLGEGRRGTHANLAAELHGGRGETRGTAREEWPGGGRLKKRTEREPGQRCSHARVSEEQRQADAANVRRLRATG